MSFNFQSRQYNIKKKEEIVEQPPQEEPNPLMRKKKTPEELAAEAEQEDLDDFTSKYTSPSSRTQPLKLSLNSLLGERILIGEDLQS